MVKSVGGEIPKRAKDLRNILVYQYKWGLETRNEKPDVRVQLKVLGTAARLSLLEILPQIVSAIVGNDTLSHGGRRLTDHTHIGQGWG